MAILAVGVYVKFKSPKKEVLSYIEVKPEIGNILKYITAIGEVQPQNRIEVKPTVAGRIEKILVSEGQSVKAGQILAQMSSTERAALLDAALAKGQQSYKYWEEVYKAIPIVAPIAGQVIVRQIEPGQSVNAADAVIVISDKLIVKANVDETDIGKVKVGQKVVINLDAYPNEKVNGIINHISYESKVVSNVTIYEVDVVLFSVPKFFRSGMSANINILINSKINVLNVPLNVVQEGKRGKFVFIKDEKGKPAHQRIKTGLSNETNVEITQGLSEKDTVLLMSQKYSLGSKNRQGNPLMMNRRSSTGNARGGH